MAKATLSTEEKKARKAAADKRYREKKKAEALAAQAAIKPAAKKAAKPAAKKDAKPAKTVETKVIEKALAHDVNIVLKKPLRIFFSQKLDPEQSQMLKPGKEVTLEDTGHTHINEDGKAVKVFRFRRGAKRVYYAIEPK